MLMGVPAEETRFRAGDQRGAKNIFSRLTPVLHELVKLLQKVFPLLWERLHLLLQTGAALCHFNHAGRGGSESFCAYLLLFIVSIFLLLLCLLLVVLLAAGAVFFHLRLPGAGNCRLLLELQSCVQSWQTATS